MVVAETCEAIVSDPPRTFLEAIQWIQFFQLTERIVAHGNGYGRLDQLLLGFYRRDLAAGRISREQARGWIAELFLKYGGNYFALGGRDRQGQDATNELSRVILEAYDLNGGDNNLGVMWHKDIDPDFFNYACEVLGRHGTGTPVLINYDVLRDSELRSGVSEDHAWDVAYSGCQWYCVVGREYNDQDLNSLVLLQPMQRAIHRAAKEGTTDFEELFGLFSAETLETARALRDFKNTHLHVAEPRVAGDGHLALHAQHRSSAAATAPTPGRLTTTSPRSTSWECRTLRIRCTQSSGWSSSSAAIRSLSWKRRCTRIGPEKNPCAANFSTLRNLAMTWPARMQCSCAWPIWFESIWSRSARTRAAISARRYFSSWATPMPGP